MRYNSTVSIKIETGLFLDLYNRLLKPVLCSLPSKTAHNLGHAGLHSLFCGSWASTPEAGMGGVPVRL